MIRDILGRYEYLKCKGNVGVDTFGYRRILNQDFYRSSEWRRLRDSIIVRDDGCELGLKGHPIFGEIIVHHIEPITINDFNQHSGKLFDPDNLICCSHRMHNAIHYGDSPGASIDFLPRSLNDTCPWR